MNKDYKLTTRTAGKRLRSQRNTPAYASGSHSGSGVTISGSPEIITNEGHTHANMATLDQIGTDADGYLTLTHTLSVSDDEGTSIEEITGRVKAGYADLAGDISPDSPIYDKFLRKDIPDTAHGHITFENGMTSDEQANLHAGLQLGENFRDGIDGEGGMIDGNGDAWLNSLRLRDFLEVPELRYNRTEISIGNVWSAPGGGIIENCIIESDTTGTVKLHLEQGEIGAVAAGDFCLGIYHDEQDPSANATADSDDGKGNFTFAGFRSCYFQIKKILQTGNNCEFRYELRPGYGTHPSQHMKFVAYGNDSDTSRQASRYDTRTYQRYLRSVDCWEIRGANVAAQFGDLSNLSIFGLRMDGYSAYLNNIYMSGTIEQLRSLTAYTENLMLHTADRIEHTYSEWGDHVLGMMAMQVHMEQGQTYTISARTNGYFSAKHADRTMPEGNVLLFIINNSSWQIVSDSDMAADGSTGHTFTWTKPTGDYFLRVNFYDAGTWWVERIKVEKGENHAPSWTPAPAEMLGKKGDKGDNGLQGRQGMSIRTTEWQTAKEYRNGTTADDSGIYYLDVTVTKDSRGNIEGVWQCIASHTSRASTRPGTEGGNAIWQKFNTSQPIASPLIIAENSDINFMQGNSIKIYDTDGSLEAGMGASDGVEPNIYVAPSRRPVKVSVKYLSRATEPTSEAELYEADWLNEVPAWDSSKPWLCLMLVVTYSDGTVQEVVRCKQLCAKVASSQWPYGMKAGITLWASGVDGDSVKSTTMPELTPGRDHLGCGVYFLGKLSVFSPVIAGYLTNSESPRSSKMQVMSNGEAYFGDRGGACVHLIPTHSGGLPRMELTDSDGSVAVKVEATNIKSIDDIYGGPSDNVSASVQANKALASAPVIVQSWEGSTAHKTADATATILTITTPADGEVTLDAFDLSVHLSGGDPRLFHPANQSATINITFAGRKIHTYTLVGAWYDGGANNKYPNADDFADETDSREPPFGAVTDATFSVNGTKLHLPAGEHKLSIEVKASGYNGFTASVSSKTAIAAHWRTQKRMAVLNANGFAIGDATDNYFACASINGIMQVRYANPYGIQLSADSDGIWVKRGSYRYNLLDLIPAKSSDVDS